MSGRTWPIRAALAATPAYQSSYAPRTPNEIKLNHNEAPADVDAQFKAAVLQRLATAPWHRYDDAEALQLRQALATSTGPPVDGIAVGHGANELLLRLGMALDPQTRVVSPAPDYYLYRRMAQVGGLPFAGVPLLRAGDGFTLDIAGLIAAAAQGPALLALSNPNNPTGQLFAPTAIDRLLAEFPGPVLLDEAYVPFGGLSRLADLARRPGLAILGTLSKAQALAGVRVGYLLAEPTLVAQLAKLAPPYPFGVLETTAAVVALERADLAQARVAAVVQERERVVRTLRDLGVRVGPSAGSFVLLQLGVDRPAVLARLAQAELAVRDIDRELPGCVRISIGTASANDRALAAVALGLRDGG